MFRSPTNHLRPTHSTRRRSPLTRRNRLTWILKSNSCLLLAVRGRPPRGGGEAETKFRLIKSETLFAQDTRRSGAKAGETQMDLVVHCPHCGARSYELERGRNRCENCGESSSQNKHQEPTPAEHREPTAKPRGLGLGRVLRS